MPIAHIQCRRRPVPWSMIALSYTSLQRRCWAQRWPWHSHTQTKRRRRPWSSRYCLLYQRSIAAERGNRCWSRSRSFALSSLRRRCRRGRNERSSQAPYNPWLWLQRRRSWNSMRVQSHLLRCHRRFLRILQRRWSWLRWWWQLDSRLWSGRLRFHHLINEYIN